MKTSASLQPQEEGLVIIEWILIVGAIIVPAVSMIYQILVALEHYYAINSWVVSLPFP